MTIYKAIKSSLKDKNGALSPKLQTIKNYYLQDNLNQPAEHTDLTLNKINEINTTRPIEAAPKNTYVEFPGMNSINDDRN